MKSLILFASFLLSSFLGQSQTYTGSCVPSGNMKAIYRNDAYRLAIQRVNDIHSPWKDSVAIPEIYIDSIARALYAIQNMHTSAVRDTIMTNFGYQNFANSFYQTDSSHIHDAGSLNSAYYLKKIRITILNTQPWATDWANGNFNNTAEAAINDLFNRYNLHAILNSYQIYGDKTIYIVNSQEAFNMPALRTQFLAIPGVVYAESDSYFGSGNSIRVDDILNGDVLLTHSIGCGDCLLGCTYGRIWHFKIHTSTDCSVEYLGAESWGLIVYMPDMDFSCVGVVVPIKFTSIAVSQKIGYQLVEWQMAMEDNVASYVVERSSDAIHFSAIGEIDIVHNASGAISYSWNDRDLISGKNFYRIRITDRSGAIQYSPIAILDVKLKPTIRVIPTLVTNSNINIQFAKVEKGIYYIDVLNTAGQKLFSMQTNISTDAFTKQIQIPSTISPGTYVVSVHGMSIRQNQLIVVSK